MDLVRCESVLRRRCVDEQRDSKKTENDPQGSCHEFFPSNGLEKRFWGKCRASLYSNASTVTSVEGRRRFVERRQANLLRPDYVRTVFFSKKLWNF